MDKDNYEREMETGDEARAQGKERAFISRFDGEISILWYVSHVFICYIPLHFVKTNTKTSDMQV
jgi:hypothetical protein